MKKGQRDQTSLLSTRVPKKSNNLRYRFEQIPMILFESLSGDYGEGEELRVVIGASIMHVRNLKKNHPNVGFFGSIGYSVEVNGRNEFYLFDRRLTQAKVETVWEPSPLLVVTAGQGYDDHRYRKGRPGVWAKLRDDTLGGVFVDSLGLKFASMVIVKTIMLQSSLTPGSLEDFAESVQEYDELTS